MTGGPSRDAIGRYDELPLVLGEQDVAPKQTSWTEIGVISVICAVVIVAATLWLLSL